MHSEAWLVAVALLALTGSAGAGGLFVGFEQGEGYPDFLGNVNGLTVNGVTWTVLGGLAADTSGDGPGLRTEDASNPSISDTPPPVDGVAQLLADGRDGGAGQIARVEIDLDNNLDLAFDSLYYANRGGYLPRLRLEYYDLNEQLLGTNLYGRGPEGLLKCYGCGVGLDGKFRQQFQRIEPGPHVQGVALPKVIVNSWQNEPRNGHSVSEIPIPNHGSFHLDSIQFVPATTTFNPNNDTIIGFEASQGFPEEDGASVSGVSIPNVLDGITTLSSVSYQVPRIDHGPYGSGAGDEDDPVFGDHALFVGSASVGDEEATIEVDLNNSFGGGLISFYYAYRGNGSMQSVTVDYYDLNDQLMGSETFQGSPDGGQALGMGPNSEQDYDLIEVDPQFAGKPMSKFVINSNHNVVVNDCDGVAGPPLLPCQSSFGIDEIILGTRGGLTCDFDISGECDEMDIDMLAAAVRNSTSDSKFNVDGIGDANIPDEEDFDYYITDDSMLSTGLGDHDLNFLVNFADFVKISNNFGMTGTGWTKGNGNTDDVTNFNDFVRVSNNFGMDFTSAANVPEPTSLTLGLLAAIIGGLSHEVPRRRWRRTDVSQ